MPYSSVFGEGGEGTNRSKSLRPMMCLDTEDFAGKEARQKEGKGRGERSRRLSNDESVIE